MNAPHPRRATGRSVWIDPASRNMLASGMLHLLVEGGVSGAVYRPRTLNIPASNEVHENSLPALPRESAYELAAARQRLTVRDVIDAADVLRPIYDSSGGCDGFVSVEISRESFPVAWRAFEEASALWDAISRPNVLIGFPGTHANLPAIRRLLIAGINVNFTLLFSAQHYREAFQTVLSSMEARLAMGLPVGDIAAVATVPLARLDQALDVRLKRIVSRKSTLTTAGALDGRSGAIACAVLACRESCAIQASRRFGSLARHGTRPLQLHWALTPGAGPDDSAARYHDPRLGADAIWSVPAGEIAAWLRNDAFARQPGYATDRDFLDAQYVVDEWRRAGIEANSVAQQLQDEEIALRASVTPLAPKLGEPMRGETAPPAASAHHWQSTNV